MLGRAVPREPQLLDAPAVLAVCRLLRVHLRRRLPRLPQVPGVLLYVTFWLNFHHFDHFELDFRGHIHVRGADVSCLRLKLADIVLI